MNRVLTIISVAALHFAASSLLPVAARRLLEAGLYEGHAMGYASRLLVVVTKVLYFPILSLALYPRPWFPGNWIQVVVFTNSLLWASGICLSVFLARRWKKQAG